MKTKTLIGWLVAIGVVLVFLNYAVFHWISPKQTMWLLILAGSVWALWFYNKHKENTSQKEMTEEEGKKAILAYIRTSEFAGTVDYTNKNYNFAPYIDIDEKTNEREALYAGVFKQKGTLGSPSFVRVIWSLSKHRFKAEKGNVTAEYLDDPFKDFKIRSNRYQPHIPIKESPFVTINTPLPSKEGQIKDSLAEKEEDRE